MDKVLYGLENSHNWGWDWFSTIEEARNAWRDRRSLYGHNEKPLVMTRAQIERENL
jgi:hypothetical protein